MSARLPDMLINVYQCTCPHYSHRFPSEQHEVVCKQCLYTVCGRPTTISSEVTNYDPTNGRFVLVTHFDGAKVVKVADNAKYLGYSARFCDEWSD